MQGYASSQSLLLPSVRQLKQARPFVPCAGSPTKAGAHGYQITCTAPSPNRPIAIAHGRLWQYKISCIGEQTLSEPLSTKGLTGTRRELLGGSAAAAVLLLAHTRTARAEDGPVVRLDLAPDQSKYSSADQNLRDAANLLQKALNANKVEEEERLWTELISRYKDSDAVWKADVVGRAYGNRGNARSRQGKMDAALADFNEAIALCPWSVDPLLNRGVVYEALGRYDDAVIDYKAVLKAAPNDPSGWNNLGNVRMAQGAWSDAADFYGRAYKLAPGFSFAAANQSLSLYQQGKIKEAVREMRTLLRRYPDFPDMRAALTAASWRQGDLGEAESNWSRVEDPRYGDLAWLERWRRWPPLIRSDLANFLKIRATPGGVQQTT